MKIVPNPNTGTIVEKKMHPIFSYLRGATHKGKHIGHIPVAPSKHIPGVQSITHHEPGKNFNSKHDVVVLYSLIYFTFHHLSKLAMSNDTRVISIC
jgi:hypothetical protein